MTHKPRKIVIASRLTATLAGALLACSAARAQNCWLPDAFEPNDEIAAPVTNGLLTGLNFQGETPLRATDTDRFVIEMPPRTRLSLDFAFTDPTGLITIAGTFTERGSGGVPQAWSAFGPGQLGVGDPPVFENTKEVSVQVEISATTQLLAGAGCLEYDLNLSLTRRPCDLLGDDALEGPDDCATARVLTDGLHTDLIVFNAERVHGPDADYYRIPLVPPGEWFEVELRPHDPLRSQLSFAVTDDVGCNTTADTDLRRFVRNTSNSAKTYYLVVETASINGFEHYDLDLRQRTCAELGPDRFEPNAACTQLTNITRGVYLDLSLTAGDTDGFEVALPAFHAIHAIVRSNAAEWRPRIQGGLAPNCPSPGVFDQFYLENSSAVAVPVWLQVDEIRGLCGAYDLDVRFEPITCSSADTDPFEPNQACWTASTVNLSAPDPESGLLAALELVIDPVDQDNLRIQVPTDEVYVVELDGPENHGLELIAYPNGDCAAPPLRAGAPVQIAGGAPLPTKRTLTLWNRFGYDADYIINVTAADLKDGCLHYSLRISRVSLEDAFPGDPAYEYPHELTSCMNSMPVPAGPFHTGVLRPGLSSFSDIIVGPGQTLSALIDPPSLAAFGAPITLTLHDGLSDCSVRGATLGSGTFAPGHSSPQLDFHNTGTQARRVFVEVRADEQYSVSGHLLLNLELDPDRPFRTLCVGNAYSQVGCPCDNDHTRRPFAGCANSTGFGARLSATGSRYAWIDDLTLRVDGLPHGSAGLVIREAPGGYSYDRTFFDGKMCVSFPSIVSAHFYAGSAGSWVGTTTLAGQFGALPGDRDRLQVWYRDNDGPCGTFSNATNAIEIVWE